MCPGCNDVQSVLFSLTLTVWSQRWVWRLQRWTGLAERRHLRTATATAPPLSSLALSAPITSLIELRI